MVVLCVILLLPTPQTVRLALVVAADNPVKMILNIPADCKLQGVYLRGNAQVPREGELFVLDINGSRFKVADFGKLDFFQARQEPGFENRALDRSCWETLVDHGTMTVRCDEVAPTIRRYDLELVFEVSGPQESVRNWNQFVTLKSLQ